MTEEKQTALDRRAFFRSVLRWGLAGGLTALGGALCLRDGDANAETPRLDGTCTKLGCTRCPQESACGLPTALSYRRQIPGRSAQGSGMRNAQPGNTKENDGV